MVWHRQSETHQRHKRTHKTLGLTQQQPEQARQHQHRLDGPIREASRRGPDDQGIVGDPEPEIAALDQPAVVFGPVGHPISGLRHPIAVRLVKLERHDRALTHRRAYRHPDLCTNAARNQHRPKTTFPLGDLVENHGPVLMFVGIAVLSLPADRLRLHGGGAMKDGFDRLRRSRTNNLCPGRSIV